MKLLETLTKTFQDVGTRKKHTPPRDFPVLKLWHIALSSCTLLTVALVGYSTYLVFNSSVTISKPPFVRGALLDEEAFEITLKSYRERRKVLEEELVRNVATATTVDVATSSVPVSDMPEEEAMEGGERTKAEKAQDDKSEVVEFIE